MTLMVARLVRNSGSCSPVSLYIITICSSAEDRFRTVRPCRCTSSGSCAIAVWTRVLTFAVLMSGSEPRAKLTLSE